MFSRIVTACVLRALVVIASVRLNNQLGAEYVVFLHWSLEERVVALK